VYSVRRLAFSGHRRTGMGWHEFPFNGSVSRMAF
jgi:hypothetical protein